MKITKLKLDEDLHNTFKAKVAKEGSNMQAKMVELITEYVEEGEKKTLNSKTQERK